MQVGVATFVGELPEPQLRIEATNAAVTEAAAAEIRRRVRAECRRQALMSQCGLEESTRQTGVYADQERAHRFPVVLASPVNLLAPLLWPGGERRAEVQVRRDVFAAHSSSGWACMSSSVKAFHSIFSGSPSAAASTTRETRSAPRSKYTAAHSAAGSAAICV